MKTYRATCPRCGWTGGPYRSQKQADYSLRCHSCEKHRAKVAAAARSAARAAAVDREPKPCQHKNTHQHGTYACYTLDRCRCLPCASATAAYNRDLHRRNAYGRSDLIDAEPIRSHIADLRESGISLRQVTRHTGVHGGALTKLMYGFNGRPPARRVRKATAARILALKPGDPSLIADHRQVSGLGAARRLQALACLGWSVAALAGRAGVSRQRLDHALRGGKILHVTHLAVVALYDELWATPPTPEDRFGRGGVTRVSRAARAAGWAPPLAWDDESIDDPAATPWVEQARPSSVPGQGAVNIDSLTDCAEWGLTTTQTADRLGVSKGAVDVGMRRLDPADRDRLREAFARNLAAAEDAVRTPGRRVA